MIKTEYFMTRQDGVNLYRQYSDKNCYLERNGELYNDAVDPEDSGRVYTETDQVIYIPKEIEVDLCQY